MLLGGLAKGEEEVGEIVAEVAGVAAAEHGFEFDADLEPSGVQRVKALKTAVVRRARCPHPLGRLIAKSARRESGDERQEVGLLRDLGLGGAETPLVGDRLESVEPRSG